jgi:hypothetical protein
MINERARREIPLARRTSAFVRTLQPLRVKEIFISKDVQNPEATRRNEVIPSDGGLLFFDGRPFFGKSKTLRGVMLSMVTTTVSASLIGLEWRVGAVIAGGAMIGLPVAHSRSALLNRPIRVATESDAALFPEDS